MGVVNEIFGWLHKIRNNNVHDCETICDNFRWICFQILNVLSKLKNRVAILYIVFNVTYILNFKSYYKMVEQKCNLQSQLEGEMDRHSSALVVGTPSNVEWMG